MTRFQYVYCLLKMFFPCFNIYIKLYMIVWMIGISDTEILSIINTERLPFIKLFVFNFNFHCFKLMGNELSQLVIELNDKDSWRPIMIIQPVDGLFSCEICICINVYDQVLIFNSAKPISCFEWSCKEVNR